MEEYAEVESDGGSFCDATIGPYALGKADEPAIVNEELAQPFGVNAIRTTVCREFGSDGVFYGVISAFRSSKGTQGLYQVEYNDDDVEDMNIEEYNYAYALWLKEEGWNVEEYEPDAKAVTGASSKTKKRVKDTAQTTRN
jgi:hypothetical protein